MENGVLTYELLKLNYSVLDELKRHAQELVAKVESLKQISLQVEEGNTSWSQSSGWLKAKSDEFNYHSLHPELKGTAFEVLDYLPLKVYRARLMILNPGDTYSVHADPTPRVHIPLFTNPGACLVFVDEDKRTEVHLPADGRVLWVDTRNKHTAVNLGTEPRIHIVATVKDTEDSKEPVTRI
jgi:hypothetical protein